MQYQININQDKLAETTLDIVEGAIIDYLHNYCNSHSPKIESQRISDENGDKWTWVDYDVLLADMPLLRIKRKGALTPRFQKLANEGYIKTKKGQGFRLYVRITPKLDDLYLRTNAEEVKNPAFTNLNATTKENDPAFTQMNASVHETQRSIYNSNTKDSNTITPPLTKSASLSVVRAREIPDEDKLVIFLQQLLEEELTTTKYKFNKVCAKSLLSVHPLDHCQRALKFGFSVKGIKGAPRINSIADLEDHWRDLVDFAREKNQAMTEAHNFIRRGKTAHVTPNT